MGSAIVGGLIGGVAVVIGVVLAAYLERRRANHQEMKRILLQLSYQVRVATMSIFDPVARAQVQSDPSRLEHFGQVCDDAARSISELSTWSRGNSSRNKRVRSEVDKFNVMFTAAAQMVSTGRMPTETELVALTGYLRRMNQVVFGKAETERFDPAEFDKELAFHREHGLDAPYVPDVEEEAP